ncbi:MAG: hypothetical protein KBS42_00665 [Bacteroidales bacterium]|nr:hypothetical protein [Candidatus Colicola coprequi]
MKKLLFSLVLALLSALSFAETDWRLQPMRITARQDNTTIWLICHVDNDKPIEVYYDIYNEAGTLLCQYVLNTPDEDNTGNTERKGYLVGEYTPNEGIALWLTLLQGEHLTSLNKGDYVIVHGYNPDGIGSGTFTTERHLTHNIMSGTVDIAGNVMSLLVDDDPLKLDTAVTIPRAVCFARLFNQNAGATSDDIVTGLHSGPIHVNNFYLPATNLTHACYDRMFNSCNTLLDVPNLPATELKDFCYLQMFGGCYKIKTIPEFKGMTMAQMACRHMFWKCYKLESAYLPAEGLASGRYGGMFRECTGLKSLKVQFTDWKEGKHTANWVEGVTNMCTFDHPYQLQDMTDDTDHIRYMRHTPNVTVTENDTITDDRVWVYKNRHVTIQQGKTLALNTQQIAIGELNAQPSSQVLIPQGTSVTTLGATIESSSNATAELIVDGALHNAGEKTTVPCTLQYTFSDTQWHTLFFPATVTNVYTDEAVDFQMQTFNPATNAWTDFTGKPQAKTGYRIRAAQGVVRFAFASNLNNGEKQTSVSLQYADNDNPAIANWNIMGNPYLRTYNNALSQRYVYVPADDFQSFTAYHTDEVDMLPFSAYLTQAASTSPIQFSLSPLMLDNSLEADLMLFCGEDSTRTGVVFDDLYTQDYEYNADLVLLTGEKNTVQLFGLPDNLPLAFTALNGTNLSQTEVTLPLGYKITPPSNSAFSILHSPFSLSFRLSERVSDEFTHIWLDDLTLGKTTDLLEEDYSTTADATASDTRFALRFTTKGYTGLDELMPTQSTDETKKVILNGTLYLIRDGHAYTIQGQRIR